MKIYPYEKLMTSLKAKAAMFLCARLLRVKLCTGRMLNETLMYNLNDADVHDESFESASKTYSPK